jgi:signal transduction histidine kinase
VRPYSIARRLIATVLLIELVSALCVTGVALFYERHVHFRAFDILLRGRADSMLGAVQDAEDANDNVMLDGTEISVPPDDVYEVIDAGGRVLGRSANWQGSAAPGAKKSIRPESHSDGTEAFFQTELQGGTYRVIRLAGLRIVDPGDKGGGIRRYVTVYYGSSERRVWRAVLRSVSFYAISSLLVLASTGILMSWLLNRGLAPLRELAAGAARVSVTSWSFQPPEQARMTSELAPLVFALESLLRGLEHSFEQQKRFVGDAAHELKTGVAVVKTSLQLLDMKERTAEEYRAGLERCLTDCERMEGIVAQMLTLARVEENDAARPVSLRTEVFECLQEVALELKTMAEIHAIAIQIHGEGSLTVNAEAEQFKLLCTNLLMNAIQHSPADSTVTVNVTQKGRQAEVKICDQGEGIAPEDLPHIFDRFWRSDPSRSRKTGGTGLGLAICKAVVDKFGGTIEIRSQAKAGTTVLVRLPLPDPAPASSEHTDRAASS